MGEIEEGFANLLPGTRLSRTEGLSRLTREGLHMSPEDRWTYSSVNTGFLCLGCL
jgi:hypothetical protein